MELMKNKYLIFDDIEFLDTKVKNITTMNLLPDIPEKYFGNDYLLQIKTQDDSLLEAISFNLYESTDYWDILLVLNGMRSMNELPVNYDIVLNRADRKMSLWKKRGKLLPGEFTDEVIQKKYKEILEEEVEKNEKYRFIKYIASDDMSELTSDLEKIKEKTKINENILI